MKFLKLFENFDSLLDYEYAKRVFLFEFGKLEETTTEQKNFYETWEDLNRPYEEGGLINPPEKLELLRLVSKYRYDQQGIKPPSKPYSCWVRSSDKDVLYDEGFIFTVFEELPDNPIILKATVDKNDVDWERTFEKNIKFPHEKEITVKDVHIDVEVMEY